MKIGILADVHEDILRLEEALSIFRDRECEEIWGLGDFIGYSVPNFAFFKSRNAHDTARAIRKNCDIAVIGNHDLFHIEKLPKKAGEIEFPSDWFEMGYRERKDFSEGKLWFYDDVELRSFLTKKDRKYLKSLQEIALAERGNDLIMLSHYAWPDPAGMRSFFHENPSSLKKHFKKMKKAGAGISFSGHAHPDGCLIYTEHTLSIAPFGSINLPKEACWVVIPAVANGTNQNGVVVYDSDSRELEIIPFNTPPHTFPDWAEK